MYFLQTQNWQHDSLYIQASPCSSISEQDVYFDIPCINCKRNKRILQNQREEIGLVLIMIKKFVIMILQRMKVSSTEQIGGILNQMEQHLRVESNQKVDHLENYVPFRSNMNKHFQMINFVFFTRHLHLLLVTSNFYTQTNVVIPHSNLNSNLGVFPILFSHKFHNRKCITIIECKLFSYRSLF